MLSDLRMVSERLQDIIHEAAELGPEMDRNTLLRGIIKLWSDIEDEIDATVALMEEQCHG